MNRWKGLRYCSKWVELMNLERLCGYAHPLRPRVAKFEIGGHSGNHYRSFTPDMSFQRRRQFIGESQLCYGVGYVRHALRRPGFVSGEGKQLCFKQKMIAASYRHKHSKATGSDLPRSFALQLWAASKKRNLSRRKKKRQIVRQRGDYSAQLNLSQPPLSQSVSAPSSSSPLEAKVETLLARSNLLITRDIEWANLVLSFEQENRYVVMDVCHPKTPAGFIREQSNVLFRQLLRTRRPFVAYIVDSLGNELFKVRRPFWWLTSSIYAEIDGQEIGVVHRRWHLWRRLYDLYLGNTQFAVVENPGLWNWTFTLKDINGDVLAQIDRDWRGFGFEIFTDAGQYVIRFGRSDSNSLVNEANSVQDLEVVRPLTLSERAVAVALAISLDNDYFSRHGGWGIPFFSYED